MRDNMKKYISRMYKSNYIKIKIKSDLKNKMKRFPFNLLWISIVQWWSIQINTYIEWFESLIIELVTITIHHCFY